MKIQKPNRGQNYPRVFADALRSINRELCAEIKDGRRKYLHKKDLEHAFDRFKGYCAYCSKTLRTKGRRPGAVQFMLRQPLRGGGKVDKDNLLPVCKDCKFNHRAVSSTLNRVQDFNTIPDLIVRLFEAEGDEQVRYFKRQINAALAELTNTLHYKPIGPPLVAVERVEGSNTAADLIEELAKVFQEIAKTKQYRPVKGE